MGLKTHLNIFFQSDSVRNISRALLRLSHTHKGGYIEYKTKHSFAHEKRDQVCDALHRPSRYQRRITTLRREEQSLKLAMGMKCKGDHPVL